MVLLLLLIASTAAAAPAGGTLRILVLGDSLTAGYGLAPAETFPAQLEKALLDAGYDVAVINAGVSGDTTAGGLARLDWSLADEPHLVIVELGGNDALRGLPPEQTRQNLEAIITRLKERGIVVLLTGMRAPRNLGFDYYSKFDNLYPALSARHDVALYPFFLDGVATIPDYNQADGIHPNPDGVAVIVRNLLPILKPLINQAAASR